MNDRLSCPFWQCDQDICGRACYISFFPSPKNVAGEISYFDSFICSFIYIQNTDKNEIEFIKQAANNALIAQETLHSLALQHVLSMEYGFLYNTNKK